MGDRAISPTAIDVMKRASLNLHAEKRRGSVLIVVLWASIGLVSIALLFGHSMAMNYRGADNDLAGRQADAAIEGAIRYVETVLQNTDTPGLFPDPTTYDAEAMPVGEATFWLLGRPDDPNDTTTRTFGLVDEAGKLNLNAFLATDMDTALQNFYGVTPDIADAIVDWRDPNGTGAGTGGVNATTVKHGPFESIEELALISGMTRDILYGEDANLNGVLDPNEDDGDRSPPADNSDGKLDPGLLEYVTVFSREPNTRSDTGAPRVNVTNAASKEMSDMLAEFFDASRVTQLLAPFQTPRGVPGQPPPSAPPQPTSALDFCVRSGMLDTEFDQIVDFLTTVDPATNPFIPGRVNVNTANATVLACVPGLTADTAATLVSARLSNPTLTTSIAWVKDQLDAATVRQAGPYLTGESFQVSADIAAVGRHGRGYRRVRVVIDMSNTTTGPQVVYRRNLGPLGWALGRDIREQLALKKELR
jgi:type II secretory pathway component PulK